MGDPNKDIKTCPKCKGDMKWGFFREAGLQSRWMQSIPTVAVLAPKIDTYACEKCGFCELYVRNEE